ncbi:MULTISPECIES: proton-conducting transporter membrane subunit [unclassified Rhizobium]|uniref:proton-conducting transporter transmembrane domain-containing protein n=1 Tax=unclassified Rhizobium TaxID=2613769 RepID=UPI0006460DA7|nr:MULTISPECIES: proton-conducting transporter membrane subunit [unclassified Rhizobium]OCI97146.1 oxidoreductase [Rhizobium sp. AC27/96]RKD50507.1 NAD(P)H-quinone oxidoreductase subunit 5 [Rhizobium sp. WW_1]TIX93393.1 oxidoreductase [Rhizobium sp. P44RR-XXIV]TXH79974.1 MAG: oxidoreductase [Rhizobium sp.]
MIVSLPLIAPMLLAVASVYCFLAPGLRPRVAICIAELSAIGSFGVAVLSCIVLALHGPETSPPIGFSYFTFASRLDLVSLVMLLLVSFIGWVVLRYAGTFLDGEARQGPFTGWMTATLAAVLFLVQSGTLMQLVVGWVASSLFLHQLLLFYPERIAAQRAARNKFIVSRMGDLALVGAMVLLVVTFGTADIATILTAAREGEGLPLTIGAAALLAIAALVKSAQFPTHGWLTEVMETPTPVSALLHAGVVNGGGFLLIRFADVLLQAPIVLAVLVMVGGFTAVFGSLVMLTQSAVKTSLAWSTVAQMGFMILQCGLALFPIALLHIVAHSLYKAHAFLSSGSAIETVSSIRRPGPVTVPSAKAVGRAFLAALAIYAVIGLLFGFAGKPPQALALGAILIFGVAYLIAQGLADAAPRALTWRTSLYAIAAATAYFALQRIADDLMLGTLPATPQPGPLEWTLMLLAVVTFGVVAVAQSLFPLWAYHPAAAGLRVHLANGLYINALFDRLLGGWALSRSASPTPAFEKE